MRRSRLVRRKLFFIVVSGIILFVPAYIWMPVLAGPDVQPKVAAFSAIAPNSQYTTSATSIDVNKLLAETNQERASLGVAPLLPDQNLYISASTKCADMTAKNYWGHYAPDGRSGLSYIETIYPKYQKISENLAAGFNSSTEVVAGWMQSPSHRKALLDSTYKYVGFGVCEGDIGDDGKTIAVVQHFLLPEGNN